MIPGKSVDDIIAQVKREEANPNKDADAYSKFLAEKKNKAGDIGSAPSDRDTVNGSVVISENGTSNGTSNGDSAESWSKIQEMALVKAMKQFGKEMSDRWDRIAIAVPGRTA